MITLSDMSLSIAGKPILEHANLRVPSGHKVGIVGRNGVGKTTFLRLLEGELQPDTGTYSINSGARIGVLKQEAPASDKNLIETALEFDHERQNLLHAVDMEADPAKLADLHERLATIDAYSAEARAARILSGLGFDHAAQQRAVSDFSGGWRMRVAMAGLLFSAPDLLLLDEPTNYLDLEGTIWLENYLKSYPYTVMLISHDRSVLNNSVTSILHMNARDLALYQGSYDQFNAARKERLAQAQSAAKKQEDRRQHLQSFVDRFRYKASKARQAQSKLKILEKMEPIAMQESEGAIPRFYFPKPEEMSPPILQLEDVAVGYGDATILRDLNLRIDQDDRIGLLGANGQGKSTLLKLISERLNAKSGQLTRHSKLRVGYFAQHQVDELELNETPLEHLRRALPDKLPKEHRAILAQGGLGSEQAELKVQSLSGGQKAKLSILLATLDAPHLLILDEPTNHLDIESREALVFALSEYEGAVMLVSHDPHLMAAVADRLWLVKDGRVAVFDGDIDSYRDILLETATTVQKRGAKKPAPKLSKADFRAALAPFKAEVANCEQRVEKLQAMQTELLAKLSDKDLYTGENSDRYEFLSKKYDELKNAMKKAELLWMNAEEKLESKSKELRQAG